MSHKIPPVPVRLEAGPSLQPLPPRLSKLVVRIGSALIPPYLRFLGRVRGIRVEHEERLISAWQRMREGKSRLIIAYRHPTDSDPFVVHYVLSTYLRRAFRRAGISGGAPFHVHHIYDRGVPLWFGPVAQWVLPRAGAVAVHRSRMDKSTANVIRAYAESSPYPLAVAPEGAVTYHTAFCPVLEDGVLQFAHWASANGAAAEILPLHIEYRHKPKKRKRALRRLITETEALAGITGDRVASEVTRLSRLQRAVLDAAELLYPADSPHDGEDPENPRSESERAIAIALRAVAAGEKALGLPGDGDTHARRYRLEQAIWDRLFLPSVSSRKALQQMSPLRRAVANRSAAEASLLLSHVQVNDVLSCARFDLLEEGADEETLLEVALNLYDLAQRLPGGTIAGRPIPAPRKAVIRVGNPISIDGTTKWGTAARQATRESLFRAFACLRQRKEEES